MKDILDSGEWTEAVSKGLTYSDIKKNFSNTFFLDGPYTKISDLISEYNKNI